MSNYNFDNVVDRKGTNCTKWDIVSEIQESEDIIPLWIADMDFAIPNEILEAIKERANHPILGYTMTPDTYYEAVINWFKKRHNWVIKKEFINFTPGVVPGINAIISTFTKPGDDVIIQTPVYHPFARVIKNNGCNVVENPLKLENGYYYMDFENLEKVITKRTKMLILCSPHNPVGRVWKKEELEKLGEICIKNDILIVSDEIHADIVYPPNEHVVFSTINKEFAERSIICTAPNKTFNIAGLKTANIIIQNEKLRNEFEIQLEKLCISGGTIFGIIAQETAYSKGEEWYQQLMKYLNANVDYTIEFFETRIPKIKVKKPEGTYLLWLDCSDLNMNQKELNDFFIKDCKVLLNEGSMFSEKYNLYQRMNIATSRKVLQEALERIEKGVKGF